MSNNMYKHIAIAPIVAGLILLGPVQAATVVNNGDSWVRESAPGTAYSGDLISVWSSQGDLRYGVISFDVGSLADPITAVSLSLWSQAFGYSDDDFAMVQSTIAIDPAGITGDSATWDQVAAAATLHTFENLGTYDIGAVGATPALHNVFLQSIGTAADAAFVESVRTGSGTLMLVMQAAEGGPEFRNSWGDGGGNPGLDLGRYRRDRDGICCGDRPRRANLDVSTRSTSVVFGHRVPPRLACGRLAG